MNSEIIATISDKKLRGLIENIQGEPEDEEDNE